MATLPLPGTYLQELTDSGVTQRGAVRNKLMGCIVTQPPGNQMAIETVFLDLKDFQHDGDLHIVNFIDKTLSSFYRGWGTWEQYYGKQHHADKSFLLSETIVPKLVFVCSTK